MEQYIGEKEEKGEENPITLLVYPGNGEHTLYLDDGKTKEYLEGKYKEIEIEHKTTEKEQHLKLMIKKDGFEPKETYSFVKFLRILSKPASVKFSDTPLDMVDCDYLNNSPESAYCFKEQAKEVWIKMFSKELKPERSTIRLLNMQELVPEEQYNKLSKKLSELVDPIAGGSLLGLEAVMKIAASLCGKSLTYLATQYATEPEVQKALKKINGGFQDLPVGYSQPNPWKGHKDAAGLVKQMLTDFTTWCTFLPEISGNQDNGLKYIQHFAWFYYRNPAGQDFVQGRNPNSKGTPLITGLKFTRDFSNERGAFMNSKASTAKIAQWVDDPRIEISDYILNKDNTYNYKSWNDFFTRQIKIDTKNQTIPSRPVTMPISEYPERDYIVVSPTDCIMNPLVQVLQKDGSTVRKYVENPLQEDMVLDIKNIPINLMELLGDTPKSLKEKFIGGTGLSCVLMPNTYHHFHSPVNGTIVHVEIVKSGTYGYEDFSNWVPLDNNVGRLGTDFSQFLMFQRGVIIIKVKYKSVQGKELTGYVASIPVGLDTIGSVVLDEDIMPGKTVKRGYTRLGNFLYGGSLDILLFSKGLANSAVQTRLGTQITLFNIGNAP